MTIHSSHTTRRSLLRAAGSLAIAGPLLAGCGGSLDRPGQLIVTITNDDEVAHTVRLIVTNDAGEDVTELTAADIPPGGSETLDTGAYAVGDYTLTVEGIGESPWRQTARWADFENCASLLYQVTLTREDDVPSVTAEKQCGSV